MRFLKGFLVSLFVVSCFVYCTKNSVESGIEPTSVQMFDYYYSTSKTFSLLQGTDTVLSGIGFNVASQTASGAPGFYSLSFQDNGADTVLSGHINLQAGTKYSMFIIQDSTTGSDSIRYSLVTNSTTERLPLYDSCKVRILNFARGLAYADFRFIINQGVGYGAYSTFFTSTFIRGRTYLDNNTYASLAQYFTIPAISYKVRFLNGSDTLKSVMDSTYISFQKQKLYTLCLLGRYDSVSTNTSPDALRLQVISE